MWSALMWTRINKTFISYFYIAEPAPFEIDLHHPKKQTNMAVVAPILHPSHEGEWRGKTEGNSLVFDDDETFAASAADL